MLHHMDTLGGALILIGMFVWLFCLCVVESAWKSRDGGAILFTTAGAVIPPLLLLWGARW